MAVVPDKMDLAVQLILVEEAEAVEVLALEILVALVAPVS